MFYLGIVTRDRGFPRRVGRSEHGASSSIGLLRGHVGRVAEFRDGTGRIHQALLLDGMASSCASRNLPGLIPDRLALPWPVYWTGDSHGCRDNSWKAIFTAQAH